MTIGEDASRGEVKHWLGVVSREHVLRGVERGIAQIGHGKRAGLVRMAPGDRLVYYSPRVSLESDEPLQAFTAIGRILDDEVWQADEGDFRPWRRRVGYLAPVREVPVRALAAELDLTSGPNWGYRIRRGLISLDGSDFSTIRQAMEAV